MIKKLAWVLGLTAGTILGHTVPHNNHHDSNHHDNYHHDNNHHDRVVSGRQPERSGQGYGNTHQHPTPPVYHHGPIHHGPVPHQQQSWGMDPMMMMMMLKDDSFNNFDMMMMMQSVSSFNSPMSPILLAGLLKGDGNNMNDRMMQMMMMSGSFGGDGLPGGMSAMLPILMMDDDADDDFAFLLYAGLNSKFNGDGPGDGQGSMDQRALIEYLLHKKKDACQVDLGSGLEDCKCSTELETLLPFLGHQSNFAGMSLLLDDETCEVASGDPCYCCNDEATDVKNLLLEFMMAPTYDSHDQANVWMSLFEKKHNKECHKFTNAAGDDAWCKRNHMPTKSANPMYGILLAGYTCYDEDGALQTEGLCPACDNLADSFENLIPFLLTSPGEDPETKTSLLQNMNSFYPFLLKDTECVDGNTTCKCDDASDHFMSLMMSGGGMDPLTMAMMMKGDDTCDGLQVDDGVTACTCTKDNNIAMMMMLMQSSTMHHPPQRAIDLNQFILSQMGVEQNDAALAEVMKWGWEFNDPNFKKAYMFIRQGMPPNIVRMLLDTSLETHDTSGDDYHIQKAFVNYLVEQGIASVYDAPLLTEKFLNVELRNPGPHSTLSKDFMTRQLISSGEIDPLFGYLLLNGGDMGPIRKKQFMLAHSFGQVDLSNWSKGDFYVPADLPAGVYPGAQLYFAQLESLGVDTCAIIQPKNRKECGWKGISAAQCEQRPYCCFNPILNNDPDYDTVPWCYHNVYQTFADEVFVRVKSPGDFADPASECPGLFKHGLELPAEYFVLSGASKYVNGRQDCGYPGITEFECRAMRGCCWDSTEYPMLVSDKIPQCFRTNVGMLSDINDNRLEEEIPEAYLPHNGMCNTNYYQIPQLYSYREPCYWSSESASERGIDPLSIPNQADCLTIQGCCWEDRPDVLEKYPYLSQCYKRHNEDFSPQASFDWHDLSWGKGFNQDHFSTEETTTTTGSTTTTTTETTTTTTDPSK